ncbi:MAG: hypothetical protein BroJett011_29460 [Chloroflexota bacterium]|nr:MAG: hypothetical protein BroJett011_29460 [Chloroflexota bacterium]
MIIVRGVFQAKYGKGGELVELFKEAPAIVLGVHNLFESYHRTKHNGRQATETKNNKISNLGNSI